MRIKQKLLAAFTAAALCLSLLPCAGAAYEEYLPHVTGFRETETLIDSSTYKFAVIDIDRTDTRDTPEGFVSFTALGDPEYAAANGLATTAKMLNVSNREFAESYAPLVDSAAVGDQLTIPVWELVADWDLSRPERFGGVVAQNDSGCRINVTVADELQTPANISFTARETWSGGTSWTADFGSGYEIGTYLLKLDFGDYYVWFSSSIANKNQSLVFDATADRAFTGNVSGAEISFRRVQYDRISADGKTLYLDVTQCVPSSSDPVVTEPEEQPSSWAQEEVSAARQEGLIPEDLDSRFESNITRAEFCHLAAALMESKTGKTLDAILAASGASPLSFSDTTDEKVEAMSALGVVNGVGNNRFEPDSDITREEAAVMLWRLAQQLDSDVQPNSAQLTFTDHSSISSWAQEAVSAVSACETGGNKIMNGTGNNLFSPQETYTREQSIVTMFRLNSYIV